MKRFILLLLAFIALLIFGVYRIQTAYAKKVVEVPVIAPFVALEAPEKLVVKVPKGSIPQEFLVYKEMIEKEFIDAPVMVKIAKAESGFDPMAKNPGSTAKGLFQIIDGTWKDTGCVGYVYWPMDNINCARKIHEDSGTTPWNESKHVWGSY